VPEKLKPGLTTEHVMHPLDRQGLQAVVDKAAGLMGRTVFDRLMREADEDFYLLNLADNTKLSPTQGASVYRLVEDVAGTLGLPTPHVFLDTSPAFKPRTMGGANASIVLPSALVDAMPDEPLRAVVGHELGYIVCGHSFYKLLAENFNRLSQLAGLIPWVGPILSAGFQLVLLDWYRKAALSADRVALLAIQDLDAVQQALLWAAGGASRVGPELSVAGLAAQATELKAETERKRAGGMVDRIGNVLSEVVLQQVWNAHPWPCVRLTEIAAWAASDEYRKLLAGEYDTVLAEKRRAQAASEPPGTGDGFMSRASNLAKGVGERIGGMFQSRDKPPPVQPTDG
jgi:Zn-dependent protease with chaperone function